VAWTVVASNSGTNRALIPEEIHKFALISKKWAATSETVSFSPYVDKLKYYDLKEDEVENRTGFLLLPLSF
jgi:hypothetical protein